MSHTTEVFLLIGMSFWFYVCAVGTAFWAFEWLNELSFFSHHSYRIAHAKRGFFLNLVFCLLTGFYAWTLLKSLEAAR